MAIHVTIDLPATRAELTHFTYLACSAADDDVLFAASEDSSQLVAIPTFGRAGDLPGEDLVVGEHGDDLDDLEADDLDEDVDTEDLDTEIPAAARIVAHLATLPDHTWHGSISELHRHLDLHCALSHTTKAIRTLTADGTITVEKAHPTRVTAIYLTATGHDVHQDPVVRPFDRDATRARAAAGI